MKSKMTDARWAQSNSKSLKFSIYLVQLLSVALAYNFKMATNSSAQDFESFCAHRGDRCVFKFFRRNMDVSEDI